MIEILYNDESSKSYGVFLYDLPTISIANESYESTSISGRRGSLISKKGAFDNITVECTFSILNKSFIMNIRALKRWLSGSGKLVISESSDCFYEVLHVERSEVEREVRKFGTFSVEFICYPYEFDNTGTVPADIVNGIIYNKFDESMPEYIIKGEGVCELTVNGNKISANVGQSVIIDTRRMMSYRNSTLMNTSITGSYDKMHLKTGNNQILITQGFELEVIPHWGWNA